jgi:hypothetical protein
MIGDWFVSAHLSNCATPQKLPTAASETAISYMNDRLLLRIATFAVVLFCRIALALAEVPSGHEFENLLAVGPEGTTILFQGGTDKVFFSPTLKNRLRTSPELGTGFLKEKIMPYTLAEATLVSADVEGGSGGPSAASRHCRRHRRWTRHPDLAADLSPTIPASRPSNSAIGSMPC